MKNLIVLKFLSKTIKMDKLKFYFYIKPKISYSYYIWIISCSVCSKILITKANSYCFDNFLLSSKVFFAANEIVWSSNFKIRSIYFSYTKNIIKNTILQTFESDGISLIPIIRISGSDLSITASIFFKLTLYKILAQFSLGLFNSVPISMKLLKSSTI